MSNRTLRKLAILRTGLYSSVLVFFLTVPTKLIEKGPTICVFRNFFGVRGPGCGLTRAISSIFRGNFTQALYYNKLVVIIFPILIALLFFDLFKISKLFKNRTVGQ